MPFPLVIAAALAAAQAPDTLAAPIVAAENNFAADARRLGVRRAFLAHFDAGSWLFRPYPVDALGALARDPDDGSPLEWGPEIAGVAASGDMGFTSGAWSAHAPGTDTMAHGHFLTVWKRGDDGIWRVQVDGGISHPAMAQPTGEVKIVLGAGDGPAAKQLDAGALAQRRRSLEQSDDGLRTALGQSPDDAVAGWRGAADADWRVLRPGQAPATGSDARELAAHDPPRQGSGPRRALDVAASGDLGYTIGGEASCAACGTYYRIWRWQDGRWRLLIDLSRAKAP